MGQRNDSLRMAEALSLARRAYGLTSPNPMVGAVLVKGGNVIGRGWHHRAGQPHAEIEALRDAEKRGHDSRGAVLYVTLEPCSTHGLTPPCTEALIAARIRKVVIGALDPNPKHTGRALGILKHQKIPVVHGILTDECTQLNEAFNHWIVKKTPFVIVKAAMTLDGKIATASGQSKWITSEQAREHGMRLRHSADAILVGINTILNDDPRLTVREDAGPGEQTKRLRRIILDARARTPLNARVVSDQDAALTTVVVSELAPPSRRAALAVRVNVMEAPLLKTGPNESPRINLKWLLRRLGKEKVMSLLVEGGGEVNASFLLPRLAQRIAFFYAPKILGGRDARRAVAGEGARRLSESLDLTEIEWMRLGPDLLLNALVK